MTTSDYLESLQNDLSRTIEALDLQEGTNFTDIAEMAENGDITTGGGGGLDWSVLGYSGTPQSIIDGYNYALTIKNNWDANQNIGSKFYEDYKLVLMPLVDTSASTSFLNAFAYCVSLIEIPLLNTTNVTSMSSMFQNCYSLTTIPQLDTSNVTDIGSMFASCYSLTGIPQLNTGKVTKMGSMFQNCKSLTTVPSLDTSRVTYFSNMFRYDTMLNDTSLDNILSMCINATSYNGTKTLYELGLRGGDYPVSRIQTLPKYQDFISAGWTIGY